MLKKIVLALVVVVAVAAVGVGLFAWTHIRAFDESLAKTYSVPLPPIERSTDPAVIERGKHLAESIGGCIACHGANLGGGRVEELGPIARFVMPNLTTGKNGIGAAYSDAELARVVRHGIKRDGRGTLFMPSVEFSWWPNEDLVALVSYLRTVPPVDSVPAEGVAKPLGKVLDRLDKMPLDYARRIDHGALPEAPAPSVDPQYGSYVARLCQGCHGEHLSGGRIPASPPEIPMPLNLTPHETGLKEWTFADFDKLMREGIRKNGQKLHTFMPVETTKNFNETEMQALWAYLKTVPARPLGER